jgi:hypothetical protein
LYQAPSPYVFALRVNIRCLHIAIRLAHAA